MILSPNSLRKLEGVHPDLVRVIKRAAEDTPLDFIVTEGVRTLMRQGELYKAGASQTMNSRHLIGKDGFSKAVDLAAVVSGDIRWDWPLYPKLGAIVKEAANKVNVPIEWGGDWTTFKDGPHFQLPVRFYE